MDQKITNLTDLITAVQESGELSIEALFEKLEDENLVNMEVVKNPNVISNGKVHFEMDSNNGKLVKVVCPFHDTTNNGSGRINLEDNYYKCFNSDCHASKPLNIIHLYMVLKFGIDPQLLSTEENRKRFFPKAVKELAELANIPYELDGRKITPEQKEKMQIQAIREEVAEIYHQAFFEHKNAKMAFDYMMDTRGFKNMPVSFKALVKEYKIGFSPGWTYAYDKLKHKFSDELLIKAGVIRKGISKKNVPFTSDFLSCGVVIPYFSKGKINNLYSRNLKAANKDFRHLRLKGSVNIPINFDVAKNFKEIFIVEGEISWLSMVAMGYKNTIGSRGTEGLKESHISQLEEIKNETKNEKCSIVYLCFDPDKSGQAAIAKVGTKLVARGFDVRVIRLKDGDPNDFIKENKESSKEKMDKLISEAISYEAFMIGFILSKAELSYNSSNSEVLHALKTVQPFIEKTPKIQLAFIIPDVIKYLNSSRITEEMLNSFWLFEKPVETKKEVPTNLITNETFKFNWLLLTDNKERFEAFVNNGCIKNVILINNIEAFISLIKKHSQINSFMYDEAISDETLNKIYSVYPNFKYTSLDVPDVDFIKNASKEDFWKHLKKTNIS